jgi:perosamine synthetase
VQQIRIEQPKVAGRGVTFAWTAQPDTSLYRRTSFDLRFPACVDVGAVPEQLWWRIALLCLHAHWPLLRPCRVSLPVRLPPGEDELWLRLTDAAVATLEAHAHGEATARSVEIVGSGPMLDALRPAREGETRGVVSCFSGGRDSIVQAAMLSEVGAEPALVTVTSPVSWSDEHTATRRREVLSEITRRRGLEVIEVDSDMRAGWDNSFAADRYGLGVNELTDTFLYLSAAIVVAVARGARLVLMASEAEVQENGRRAGMVVQARHFMYSAATHQALAALLAPAGVGMGSLTYPLRQFQVQRLLSERYSDLRDLQYSCWQLNRDEPACSRCAECRGIALNLIATGVAPAVAGIDLVELLLSHVAWEPGGRLATARLGNGALPRARAGVAHEQQELRCLVSTSPAQVAELLDGAHPAVARERALEIYRRLRADALRHEIEPEPGYRDGYLELVDVRVRERVRAILDDHFSPAPPESYAATLRNTRTLANWIAAPLRQARRTAATNGHRARGPAPEPTLLRPRGGRLLRVAETSLDGNELSYVTECVDDNWISSAGSFVPRFEEAFGAAVDCRFAVACSSGTAALHLALAASGVSSGDEVILPAFTMIATANAVRYLGADPALVDADPLTWNIDHRRLGDKLSRRTCAVIAVHTYGRPAEMDPIRDFADRNGLTLVEDAAEAHGARYSGRPVGSIGDVAAFSLYGNKILTTGEGGIVTTNDEAVGRVARELRDHAFSTDRHFWHRRLGFNYRMSNLQAAVGLAQTERLQQLLSLRRENARRYREALAGVDGIMLPEEGEGAVTWMFGVRVTDAFGVSRDELRRRLAGRGVETRPFFVPLHMQPIYSQRFSGQRYPVAEELGRDGLYLPSGPGLSDDDIAYVAEAVRASSS